MRACVGPLLGRACSAGDHRRSAIMTHVTRFYYFNRPPRRAAAHATRILIGRFRTGIVLSFRPSSPRVARPLVYPSSFLPSFLPAFRRSTFLRQTRRTRQLSCICHEQTRLLIRRQQENSRSLSRLPSKNHRRGRRGSKKENEEIEISFPSI